ncbi:hypothetical protein HDU86_002073 [Geranomyces michiganensis]|nr:hypothetical protein HDU86_002073 [Geranomyces michiganensis]
MSSARDSTPSSTPAPRVQGEAQGARPSNTAASSTSPPLLRCLWTAPKPCTASFTDAEELYLHITDKHIGRRQTGNLSLVCAWDTCALPPFNKRDHVTSHVRIHVPLKPYVCPICGRAFKRPQDRKKHDKLHENAEVPGEHNKADGVASAAIGGPLDIKKPIRIPVPTDSLRTRRTSNAKAPSGAEAAKQGVSVTGGAHDLMPVPSPLSVQPSFSSDLSYDPKNEPDYDYSLDPSFLGGSLTPPQLLQGFQIENVAPEHALTPDSSQFNEFSPFTPESAYGNPTDGAAANSSTGSYALDHAVYANGDYSILDTPQPSQSANKRGYDVVDDFMMDFKKKKLSTTYDPMLAHRLDEIAQFLFVEDSAEVPATTLEPLESRPVEDLNDLNLFLQQLSNEIDDSSYYLSSGGDSGSFLSDTASDSYSTSASSSAPTFNSSNIFLPNGASNDGSEFQSVNGGELQWYADLQSNNAIPAQPQVSGVPFHQYGAPPAIHVNGTAALPTTTTSPPGPSYAYSTAGSFGGTPSPTTSPLGVADFMPSPILNLHVQNTDQGVFFPPDPANDSFGIPPRHMAYAPHKQQQQTRDHSMQQQMQGSMQQQHYQQQQQQQLQKQLQQQMLQLQQQQQVSHQHQHQQQNQQAPSRYPHEREHVMTPFVPTVFTLTPQQSSAPSIEDVESKDTDARDAAGAARSPTAAAGKQTALRSPRPPSVTAVGGGVRKTSSTPHADADAATDALLKQFRDMSLETEIARTARKQRQMPPPVDEKRKRHSVLVKALMHKIADRIARHVPAGAAGRPLGGLRSGGGGGGGGGGSGGVVLAI